MKMGVVIFLLLGIESLERAKIERIKTIYRVIFFTITL